MRDASPDRVRAWTESRVQAVSELHDLRLEEADVAALVEGLPALLEGLAAVDPGDLGFADPAVGFRADRAERDRP